MSVVSEFFSLQELDLALDRALARLQEIEEGLQETEELRLARQEKDEKEQAAQLLRARQKDLEWQVEEVRSKATEVEAKLYGGSVRNPKELSDLDADLKALKAQTARREDALLALLVEIDEAEAESRKARDAYTEIESAAEARFELLMSEKSKVGPEIDDLRIRRKEMAASVDRSSLSLYQLLRDRKGGLAVARVEQGMCQGCRISLPAVVLQKARAGPGLVQCVSCERMLFVG